MDLWVYPLRCGVIGHWGNLVTDGRVLEPHVETGKEGALWREREAVTH